MKTVAYVLVTPNGDRPYYSSFPVTKEVRDANPGMRVFALVFDLPEVPPAELDGTLTPEVTEL